MTGKFKPGRHDYVLSTAREHGGFRRHTRKGNRISPSKVMRRRGTNFLLTIAFRMRRPRRDSVAMVRP